MIQQGDKVAWSKVGLRFTSNHSHCDYRILIGIWHGTKTTSVVNQESDCIRMLGMVIHPLVWSYILMMFGFPMRRMAISHKPTTKKMTLVQIYNILFASGLYTIQLTLILSTSFPLYYIYILYTCDFILIWFSTTERDTNPSGKFHSFSNFGWL